MFNGNQGVELKKDNGIFQQRESKESTTIKYINKRNPHNHKHTDINAQIRNRSEDLEKLLKPYHNTKNMNF